MSITTGNSSAATPTLFMKADITPAVSIITAISRSSPVPARRKTWRPIRLATPVRDRAPLRMKTAQTVITAGLLKPDIASAGVTRPIRARAASTSRATTSTLSHSVTKSTTVSAMMAMTRAIWNVIAIPRFRRCSPPAPVSWSRCAFDHIHLVANSLHRLVLSIFHLFSRSARRGWAARPVPSEAEGSEGVGEM